MYGLFNMFASNPSVGSATGSMAGGMDAMQGIDTNQFSSMGAQQDSGGLFGMSNSMLAGLMGGGSGGGGGGYGKMAYQQGLSSGPGGANDMSQYANIPSLMQMVMNKEQQKQSPGNPYMGNSYVNGLMGI